MMPNQEPFIRYVCDRIERVIQPRSILVAYPVGEDLLNALSQRGYAVSTILPADPALSDSTGSRSGSDWPQPWSGAASELDTPGDFDLGVLLDAPTDWSADQVTRAARLMGESCQEVLIASERPDQLAALSESAAAEWSATLIQYGLVRDLYFALADGSETRLLRFLRARPPALESVVLAYEQRLAQAEREARLRRAYNVEREKHLFSASSAPAEPGAQSEEFKSEVPEERLTQTAMVQSQNLALLHRVSALELAQSRLQATVGWAMLKRMQAFRAFMCPPGSTRDRWLERTLLATWVLRQHGWRAFGRHVWGNAPDADPFLREQSLIPPISPPEEYQLVVFPSASIAPPELKAHQGLVSIVICVHDALDSVRTCLESVLAHSFQPYELILVDDGSQALTQNYLAEFSKLHQANLIRHDLALGYTRAANSGIRTAKGDYLVLLNSDTIVTTNWLSKLVACVLDGPEVGLAGPLSNTASWQSVPEIESMGDWAANPLPDGVTVDDMARQIESLALRLRPRLPFLNGFCLLIKRKVLEQIGEFDERNFGAGYGEENDYLLRARAAGWEAAVADDLFVFHAQSKSYTTPRRLELYKTSAAALVLKHGQTIIDESATACKNNRTLAGIRARTARVFERQNYLEDGRAQFGGKRVLFVLPTTVPGGGSNVVMNEAAAMRKMGVSVEIFNLAGHRDAFSAAYSSPAIPVRYGFAEDLPNLASHFNAIVATVYSSVPWLAPVLDRAETRLGYYIQDFEPMFYPSNSLARSVALASYSVLPGAALFCKTEWNRDLVRRNTGKSPAVVGPSLNVDLFRPRPRRASTDRITIAAMIRPETVYRSPEMTMRVLREIWRRYRENLRIFLFGTTPTNPDFLHYARDFDWKLAGVIPAENVASLLNESDIFVDFSQYQAMGLTAMEAMACGCATIVPQKGGANSFAVNEQNSLFVDTSSEASCLASLDRLVTDPGLRLRLQMNAIRSMCDFYPEKAAYNILRAIFASSPNPPSRK